MKITGYIFLILGVLSFIGAASYGNSVVGPCFWIALGAYLIHKAKCKVEDNADSIKNSFHTMGNGMKNETDSLPVKHNNRENLENIQSNLSTQQKEAALGIIIFFAGFNTIDMGDITANILHRASVFYGVSDDVENLTQTLSKYSDAESLISTIVSIKHEKSKEFLLLTCYDLAKLSEKQEPLDILHNIADEMGYNREQFQNLVNQYS